ncbi:MAG: hypothetical protein OXM55_00905 [Bdellovibrionales bacterium]|nr:hypothetical protein [Bdellovibrionales bacterium]
MKILPEKKYTRLYENEYSEPIDISYFDDPNIKKLSISSNRSKDAVIKLQLYNKKQFKFKVHNHCGYLKIGPVSYFIVPKMGESFLETMFKVLNRSTFSEYQNKLKQDSTEKLFDEFIAYLFIGSFNRTLSGKMRKGYISKNISTYKSSGRIDIDKSKEFFTYSVKPPTWLRNEWTRNTKFNKALRTLFLDLSCRLDISNNTKSKLVKIGLELADSNYIGHTDYQQLLHQLDRVHESYRHLFELAVSLNLNGGISSGPYQSSSLLLQTWSLFEQACRLTISKLLSPEFEVNIKDLFARKASEDAPKNVLKPDIVIKNKSGGFVKIGDCKYRRNSECKLEYLDQLNTYMDAYRLSKSFILYPNETIFRAKTKSYRLNWGHQIDIINIPINNRDNFRSAIKGLLNDLPTTRLNVASA